MAATPFWSDALPSVAGGLAELSVNDTLPVGVPEAPLTVAVRVTEFPDVAGLAEDARTVVVEASEVACTATLDDPDMLAAKLLLPL